MTSRAPEIVWDTFRENIRAAIGNVEVIYNRLSSRLDELRHHEAY